jgi:hypothetical protein
LPPALGRTGAPNRFRDGSSKARQVANWCRENSFALVCDWTARLYDAEWPWTIYSRETLRLAARARLAWRILINFRDDPVSYFVNVEHLIALHPAHCTLLELPHPTTKGNLALVHSPEVIAFIEDRFDNPVLMPAGIAATATYPR